MISPHIDTVRETIAGMLVARGQEAHFGEDESLFDSGRLDSIAAVDVLMTLESRFGIDLSDPDFDISRIDTLQEIDRLLMSHAS